MEKNQIFENIMSRTSVRSYTDMPPLAIVVCGCLDKTLEGTEQEFWIQDCSAATENILLMAHGLGLGGVWTALYPLKERYEGMQQLLHLPKTMIPLNTLIIGYPKNLAEAKDKWKEENVSYNKWMEKIHNTRKSYKNSVSEFSRHQERSSNINPRTVYEIQRHP